MNAISTITVMPVNSEEEKIYISKVKNDFLSGYENPLKILSKLKRFERILKNLLSDDDINNYIIDEFDKHHENQVEIFGAKFDKRDTGVKYDFSVCENSEYNDVCVKIQLLTELKKEYEEQMKIMTREWVKADTGEVIKPALKTSTTKIVVTLK